MANYLKVTMIEKILALHDLGWPQRRIARELEVDRGAVARYVRQKRPEVTAGSAGENQPEVTAGWERRRSLCLSHEATIVELAEEGLTAQRIYQELVAEHGFTGSYSSVKRFVRQVLASHPVPFRRLESPPGHEAQLDFGKGATIVEPGGRRRRPHLFRIVLSHSRKAYSEVVWRQDTETLIRVLENALRHFGGVPQTLVPDNLKAAVIRADWADPELNPKLVDFCRHYGTVLLPTKVRTPRHKGKVERGVAYVQENALKGRTFGSLDEQNAFLWQWERTVADTRVHGTTRMQVGAAFAAEKAHLGPLPESLFPVFEEGVRKVHRDGHVEVARSYYSAPPEFLGRELLVRYDLRTVRLYHPTTMRQVRVHPRVEPGAFHTDPADIPATKIALVERGEHYLLTRLGREVGTEAVAWASAMLKARGIEGIRVLIGLLSLGDRLPAVRLDAACREARKRQRWQLRAVRDLAADAPVDQPDLDLQQQHPLIRDLNVYQQLVGDFTA